ncbi:MAG TPA: hypothetical protein ENK57_11070 [Polyangiaceae bacterium]|nr:hypothetical protein [Polyangiaceae bacterium]
MVRKAALGSSLLLLTLGLVSACGSDSEFFGESGVGAGTTGAGAGTGTGTGGSVGEGGATSQGGSTSDGGSTADGGSTGDGGSAMGGSTGDGGGGAGGMGGGTINPPTCPDTKPMDGGGCDPMGFGGLTCDFGNDTCKCSGFPSATWTCTSCTTAPMDGSPCMDDGQACIAGTSHCECGGFGSNLTWSCFECPNPPPMDGEVCSGNNGADCMYGTTSCSCGGFGTPEWNCETCPAQPPNNGDACADFGQFCDYPNTNGCLCLNGQWSCF